MDSGLGESYGSLANVQLPSRNHANFRGIRSNGNRVIAAVALSCTIPSASSKVTDYSIRRTGGEANFWNADGCGTPQTRLEFVGTVPKAKSSTLLPQSFVTTGNPDRSSASAR